MNVRFGLATVLFVALATACSACSKTETSTSADAAPVAVSTSSAVASAPAHDASSAAPVTAESDPLPSHSDAASKVRGEITKNNYRAELDKVEKEIE